jgi:two-component system, OmpR family, sensor kinase
MRSGLPLRRRLLLSVIGALAIALVVLIGAFNLVLRERLSSEANSALAARSSAELASLDVVAGRLAVAEAPDAAAPDTQAWVFAGSRVLEQPPADPPVTRAATRLGQVGHGTEEPAGTPVRLYAVPVVAGGRRLGSVVTAISLTPYDNTAETALIASVVLGVLLLLAAALAARFVIVAALRPVANMTAQAAAWSQVDTGRRFGLGPPRDELTQLADTLDGLLDRVASSLRHEQRFSAELSHELRSPLASVIAEAQLALRHSRPEEKSRAGYERILAAAQQMRRTLETLMAAERIEHRGAGVSGDAGAAAHAAASGCDTLAANRGITITVQDPPAPLRVGVETEVAERVLFPLVENACRYGASSVRIGLEHRGGAVVFRVEDDGPGVAERDRERVFDPGWRNGAGDQPDDQGAGLGLPLARRLARAAGGDVYVEPGAPGGRFAVRLPQG